MFEVEKIETSRTGDTSSRTRIVVKGERQPDGFGWCWDGHRDYPTNDGTVHLWRSDGNVSVGLTGYDGYPIWMTIEEMKVRCEDFPPMMFRTNATWGSGYGGDIVVLSKNGDDIFVHDRWAARLDKWDFIRKNIQLGPDGKLFIP